MNEINEQHKRQYFIVRHFHDYFGLIPLEKKILFKNQIVAYNQYSSIGDRKDGVCLPLHGQKSSSSDAAISAMLDSKGRAFALIQVL